MKRIEVHLLRCCMHSYHTFHVVIKYGRYSRVRPRSEIDLQTLLRKTSHTPLLTPCNTVSFYYNQSMYNRPNTSTQCRVKYCPAVNVISHYYGTHASFFLLPENHLPIPSLIATYLIVPAEPCFGEDRRRTLLVQQHDELYQRLGNHPG